MTKPHKSSDTRDQLRRLMSQHTAATTARPAPMAAAVPAAAPVAHATPPAKPVAPAMPAPVAAPRPATTAGDRCTLRLAAPELAKIDRLILETHQRVGERITTSDVLRIGLARVTTTAPITAAEIAALRASDGRRSRPQS
jgi:hypothetical protein